jgi:hypothetical protein
MTKKRSVKEMGSAQRAGERGSERARERGRSDGGEQERPLHFARARDLSSDTAHLVLLPAALGGRWHLFPPSLFSICCVFFVAKKIFGASKTVS